MISFDFEYYKPSSLEEAVQVYRNLAGEGKTVLYYCGGTEIITLARVNQIYADAVIDIKGIPECGVCGREGEQLVLGAAVTLNQIAESGVFPLLGQTVKRIADHTSRNKITLGGNLNSKLMYREGVLPLLLTDCELQIAGTQTGSASKTVNIKDVFDKELQLAPGQFLVQIRIDPSYVLLPYASNKRTRISKVDYPLVTAAAIKKENRLRFAFSGICEFPFRSAEIEEVLNDDSSQIEKRIDRAVSLLPAPIVHDISGSAEYRKFVFRHVLQDTLEQLELAK